MANDKKSNQIQPSVGRIVITTDENGADAPAVITRVWSRECVNLQVLPDCGTPYVRTSVIYSDTEAGEQHWRWPERV